jgi:hypothetical protein
MAYQDGNFTNAIQDGPARLFYPFINATTKDTTTKGTVRNYVVVPSSYTPAAALSTDPADNTQYLIEETEISVEGGLGRYARTYCKVPGQQIEPGTIVLSKPTIPGNDAFPRNFGSYLVVQPDTTLEKYDAYKRTTVTSDTGIPGFYPTGGTYSLSFDSNTTTAISYSSNAATVQSELNSFSTIQNRGNVTVSGSYNSAGGFALTFANIAAATINTAAITLTTDSTLGSSVTSTQGGYAQAFQITTTANNFTNTNPSINVSAITYTGSPGFLTGNFRLDSAPSRIFYGEIQATGNLPQITGGTFTLSLFGQTTAAISYSSNDATLSSNISTALNNLSSVTDRGGTTVTLTRLNTSSGSFYFYAYFTGSKLTGGTFSINIFSQSTSALNYNSSPSDIQTALNNLSNVQSRGNVVITSSSGTSTILAAGNALAVFSIGFSNNVFSGNAVSLTPSGSSITIVKTDGTIGRTQQITFAAASATRTLYAAGHEIDAGETIYIRNAGSVFANIAPNKVTVIDANTIQLTVAASDSWASVASITEMGPRTKVNYEPGSVVIRSKTTTDFYLPGVTAGITTADDIPIPVDESGTAAFLQGVFSGQDNINVRVGELRPWRGPILLVDRTSVASDDV